jgi:O-antigen/teichoic acid export membrane protein
MNIKKNFIFNLLGSVSPLLIGIITIPLYLDAVGLERYGVLSIVWIVLAYFVMFDLGVGKSTIYALRHEHSKEGKSQVVCSAFFIALILSVLSTSILLLALFTLSKYFFQTSPEVFSEIEHSFYIVSALLPVALFQSVVNATYESEDYFLNLNLLNVIGNSAIQIVPLLVAKFYTTNLFFLLLSIIFCRALLLLVSLLVSNRFIQYSLVSFSYGKAKALLKFGGWLTISNFVSPVIVLSNRFSISGLLGTSIVPYFSVPYQLCEKLNLVPSSLSRALFPKLSGIHNKQQLQLMLEYLMHLILITTPLCIVAIFFIDVFISIWINAEFATKTFFISQLILITIWLNGISFLPYTYLLSSGKTKTISYTHLGELIPYLILLYFLVKQFGLLGAAIAGLIRVAVDFLVLSYFTRALVKVLQAAALSISLIAISFVMYSLELKIAYDSTYCVIVLFAIFMMNKDFYTKYSKLLLGKLRVIK